MRYGQHNKRRVHRNLFALNCINGERVLVLIRFNIVRLTWKPLKYDIHSVDRNHKTSIKH